jgi:hypothetical protein
VESIFGFIDFVNTQAAFHERKAIEYQGNKREWLHKRTAETFRALQRDIEGLRVATILRRPAGINPLAVSQNDISGLPPEVLQQLLNRPENDRLESEIVDIINGAGGTLLIDHIIIGLYKRTKVAHERAQLVSKIYRMNKKGLIYSAPGKKGVYTTIPPSNAAHANMEEPPP